MGLPLTQRHPVYYKGAQSSPVTIDTANTRHLTGTHIYQTNAVQIISNSFESGTTLHYRSQRPEHEIEVIYLGLEL